MRVPRSIFRQYDIRGLVGEELTPEFAHALGRAIAAFARERLGRDAALAVGRDWRTATPAQQD
ncbi:MAG TPA: phosphomannomutase, partial [Gemmatimonadales bacterium]|nr:phosphomannomutase [Gemmatimonadales bacterium]